MKLYLIANSSLFLIILSLVISCAPPKEEETDDSPSEGSPALTAPSALFVEYTRDTSSDITVGVAGVANGQMVSLYSDSLCQNLLAQKSASGSIVEFEVTGLTSGSHSYYAKSSNGSSTTSCSLTSVSYERTNCPIGYVKVDGNPSRGVALAASFLYSRG